jgi:hypothetical protein
MYEIFLFMLMNNDPWSMRFIVGRYDLNIFSSILETTSTSKRAEEE